MPMPTRRQASVLSQYTSVVTVQCTYSSSAHSQKSARQQPEHDGVFVFLKPKSSDHVQDAQPRLDVSRLLGFGKQFLAFGLGSFWHSRQRKHRNCSEGFAELRGNPMVCESE